VKIGSGVVRQGCYLSLILFNLYSKYLAKAAVEGFGGFQIGGQIICTMKYADDLVLLATGEMVAKGMFEKLIEIGRCYGIEMDVEKN
jgi:ABC-type hemin transport system ATPase subunit